MSTNLETIGIYGLVALIGGIVTLTGRIVWDWLKEKRGGVTTDKKNNSYAYNGRGLLYQIQQDIALTKHEVNAIVAAQNSSEMKRLVEEVHELHNDRTALKNALEEQNRISIETNVLLKSLQKELTNSTRQIAAVAEGLAAALQRIKEDK